MLLEEGQSVIRLHHLAKRVEGASQAREFSGHVSIRMATSLPARHSAPRQAKELTELLLRHRFLWISRESVPEISNLLCGD